jgi:peptide/nickel transport system substrate-binding protein
MLSSCRSAVDESLSVGASKPKAGGILNMVQGVDILPALLLSQNNANFSINRTVFNTLIELDHKTLKPKPSLATSWKVSPDGRTYVFQLRDDVTYHTGRPFGPRDVAFVLDYLTKPTTTTQVKAVAEQVTSAAQTGPHEITVAFGKAVNNVWDMFEMAIMVDQETIADLASGAKIVGTGPFALESYKPGSSISLKRYDKYWKPSRPYLEGIEITIVGDSTSALALLRSGQAQLALDLSPLDAAGIRNQPGFQLIESDANDLTYYLGANVNVPPLGKEEVRQAIAWAIDRNRILNQILGDIGRASSLPWSPSSPMWNDALAATYKFDPAKARQLLRQAGAVGAKVDLYYSNILATNEDVSQIVQANLSSVGLNCQLQAMQAADYQKLFVSGKLPGLFVNGHGFGQLSPSTLVKGALPFSTAHNGENFSSSEYTKLANAVWTEKGDALKQAYQQLNKVLLEQQFVIDLVNSSHTYTISSSLKGLAYTMYDYINLDNAYLA